MLLTFCIYDRMFLNMLQCQIKERKLFDDIYQFVSNIILKNFTQHVFWDTCTRKVFNRNALKRKFLILLLENVNSLVYYVHYVQNRISLIPLNISLFYFYILNRKQQTLQEHGLSITEPPLQSVLLCLATIKLNKQDTVQFYTLKYLLILEILFFLQSKKAVCCNWLSKSLSL